MRICSLFFVFSGLLALNLSAQHHSHFSISAGTHINLGSWSRESNYGPDAAKQLPGLKDSHGIQVTGRWVPMDKSLGALVIMGFQPAQAAVGDMYNRLTQVRHEAVSNAGSDWWLLGGPTLLLREDPNGDRVFFNLLGGYRQIRLEDITETFISLSDLNYQENLYRFTGEGGWMIMPGICAEAHLFGPVSLQVSANYTYAVVKQRVERLNIFGPARPLLYPQQLTFRQHAFLGTLSLSVEL